MSVIEVPEWLTDWRDIETFDVYAIGCALSRICRYGGMTPHHYSVAQHSRFVAALVPDCRRLQLLALLHDCHEVFTGDVLRPAGRVIGLELRQLQAEIDRHLFGLIGFEPDQSEINVVEVADNMACELEIRCLGRSRQYVGEQCDIAGVYDLLHGHDVRGETWCHEVHSRLITCR